MPLPDSLAATLLPWSSPSSKASQRAAERLGQSLTGFRLKQPEPCSELLRGASPLVWATTKKGCNTYDCTTPQGREFTDGLVRDIAIRYGFQEANILAYPHTWRFDEDLESGEFAEDEEHATVRFMRSVENNVGYRYAWTCHLLTEHTIKAERGVESEIWNYKGIRWGHHGDILKLPIRKIANQKPDAEKIRRMAEEPWRNLTRDMQGDT